MREGTDLNTATSTYRTVVSVGVPIHSTRYGYRGERGFVVRIGRFSRIRIPWSILEVCFAQLNSPRGYDGTFFRQRFPLQARDHPSHVHAVGQIFVAAGMARLVVNRYLLDIAPIYSLDTHD